MWHHSLSRGGLGLVPSLSLYPKPTPTPLDQPFQAALLEVMSTAIDEVFLKEDIQASSKNLQENLMALNRIDLFSVTSSLLFS
ncbi:hypothetical protein VNO77_03068 [Canavalia gladiata]|uniref:Uncharacterized protein n=1 Tax=Canavalia gladiata TaxID=3824 RepID=A0AAN9MZ94_CANGL